MKVSPKKILLCRFPKGSAKGFDPRQPIHFVPETNHAILVGKIFTPIFRQQHEDAHGAKVFSPRRFQHKPSAGRACIIQAKGSINKNFTSAVGGERQIKTRKARVFHG
ncbi:MAG: hypothetical protein EPO07_09280 [Verrucomicrobia bacterium]|nr:MAG: hypothetical protein EPO07_09280 [Verrucomicrobiota bacterium]